MSENFTRNKWRQKTKKVLLTSLIILINIQLLVDVVINLKNMGAKLR